jgi:hypothetical protein
VANLIEYIIISPKKHHTQKVMGISPERELWFKNVFIVNGKKWLHALMHLCVQEQVEEDA